MHEDPIVAQAQRVIAARRAAEDSARWKGWTTMLLVLVSLLLGAFLIYPAPMSDKLLLAMGGVCGLRPHHSYFAAGVQLPLEARMTGIYGALTLTLGWLALQRRLGAARLGGWATGGLLGLFFVSMVIDGINSTLTEMDLPHLYTSTNPGRLITGLLSGVASGAGVAWILSKAVRWQEPLRKSAFFCSPRDLAVPLVLSALFGFLVLSERGWSYYPIALVSVSGIVITLTAAVLLMSVTARRRQLTAPRQLLGPCTLALFIALLLLAVTATLRWNSIGHLG